LRFMPGRVRVRVRPSLMLRSPKGGSLQADQSSLILPSLISRARIVLSIEDDETVTDERTLITETKNTNLDWRCRAVETSELRHDELLQQSDRCKVGSF